METQHWRQAGVRIAALLLAALIAVNAVAVWGIVSARRDARRAATRDLELRTAALARSIEAALASLRADFVFLSRSPPLDRLLATSQAGDPMVRRWSRLDAESTLLLFLEAHPGVERIALRDPAGTTQVLAGRSENVPVLLAPDDSPAPATWVDGRWPVGGVAQVDRAASELEAWFVPSSLLPALPDSDARLETAPEAASAKAPRSGWLRASAEVNDAQWRPPIRWRLVTEEETGALFRSVEALAGHFGTTVALNVAVMTLSFVLGATAMRSLRQVARLEAERRHQEEVRELERQLAHSQRLASVGRLAAGLAHEINNPLEGISNYLSLLREELAAGQTEEGQRLVERVEEGVARAAGVIRQVLSFSEPGRSAKETFDLREVLKTTVSFVHSDPRRRRDDIHLELPPLPLPVHGNRVTLGQLFLNLLLNACQAQPAAGPVEVLAEERDTEVIARVRDRGPGLDPQVRAHLFEPFTSTRGSTGLGLAVSRAIALDHDGRIEAAERAGGGAEFTVTLPAAPAGSSLVLAQEGTVR